MNLAAVPTSLFVVTALLFLEGTARNILTTNYRKVAINGPVCGSLVASCRHGAIIKNGPMWAVRVKIPPSLINVLCWERQKSPCAALTAQPNAPLWKSDCRQCLLYFHGVGLDWPLQVNLISFFLAGVRAGHDARYVTVIPRHIERSHMLSKLRNNVKCYSLGHKSQTETAPK